MCVTSVHWAATRTCLAQRNALCVLWVSTLHQRHQFALIVLLASMTTIRTRRHHALAALQARCQLSSRPCVLSVRLAGGWVIRCHRCVSAALRVTTHQLKVSRALHVPSAHTMTTLCRVHPVCHATLASTLVRLRSYALTVRRAIMMLTRIRRLRAIRMLTCVWRQT